MDKKRLKKVCGCLLNPNRFWKPVRIPCNLNGGQIDNILKKATMEEVINGKKPKLKQLMRYCKEETMEEQAVRKIGF